MQLGASQKGDDRNHRWVNGINGGRRLDRLDGKLRHDHNHAAGDRRRALDIGGDGDSPAGDRPSSVE